MGWIIGIAIICGLVAAVILGISIGRRNDGSGNYSRVKRKLKQQGEGIKRERGELKQQGKQLKSERDLLVSDRNLLEQERYGLKSERTILDRDKQLLEELRRRNEEKNGE